jgi:hypothetical protein
VLAAGPDYGIIKDFARYPELRWLNRHDRVAPVTYGVAAFLIGGWPGPGRRVLLVDGAALAHHVPRELGRARLRPPSAATRGRDRLTGAARSLGAGYWWRITQEP